MSRVCPMVCVSARLSPLLCVFHLLRFVCMSFRILAIAYMVSIVSIAQRVSTCEIKEHIGFLRAVHVASSRGTGSLLYADGPSLRAAVRAYFAWLSKAAESGPWFSRWGDGGPGARHARAAARYRVVLARPSSVAARLRPPLRCPHGRHSRVPGCRLWLCFHARDARLRRRGGRGQRRGMGNHARLDQLLAQRPRAHRR